MNGSYNYNFFLKALLGLGLEHLHIKIDYEPWQLPESFGELLAILPSLAHHSSNIKTFTWGDPTSFVSSSVVRD